MATRGHALNSVLSYNQIQILGFPEGGACIVTILTASGNPFYITFLYIKLVFGIRPGSI